MTFLNPLKVCTVGGHRLAYRREGEGETVLLVHGITTNSFIWKRVAPLLRGSYEIVAVDLLGCGGSEMPLGIPYSISRHAELLIGLTDELELGRFHLVGHDVGGGVCQIAAVRHSDRLIDLALVNSVAYDYWPVQPIVAMRTPILRQLAMATLDLGTLRMIVGHGLFRKDRLTSELMDHFCAQVETRIGRKAFLHFARSLDNKDLLAIEDDLRELPMPVLIVRGDQDPFLSLEISQRLHREIPQSRLIRFDRASHFIQEDDPEGLAAELCRFFRKQKDGG